LFSGNATLTAQPSAPTVGTSSSNLGAFPTKDQLQQQKDAPLVDALMKDPTQWNNVPAADQMRLLPTLQAKGFVPPDANAGKKVSGADAKIISLADTLKTDINNLKAAFTKGYKLTLGGILTGTDRTNYKLAYDIADKILRLRSGANAPPAEVDRFLRQIFSWTDLAFGTAASANQNLDRFISEADTIMASVQGQASTIATGGSSVTLIGPDGVKRNFPSLSQSDLADAQSKGWKIAN
jgi:hypothetical protein